ncbi:MAG: HAD-IA family hydrolase [Rhodospirillales bacterium]|nr:HAD-IA family hydrolase [Rhodospirillales bacterium]
MPHSLKALIFDLDGTLAETEEVHRQAFNDAFAEAGLDWHWDREIYRGLLAVAGGRERLAAFAPEVAADLLDRLHQAKSRHFQKRLREGKLTLRPGVAALFAQARAKAIRLAVATSSRRESALAVLAPHAPLMPLDALITGEEVGRKKPDPEIYRLALTRLCLEPGEALAIEDSDLGLASARAAGLAVLVTPGLYTLGQDFTGALAVRPSLEGLDLDALWMLRSLNILRS